MDANIRANAEKFLEDHRFLPDVRGFAAGLIESLLESHDELAEKAAEEVWSLQGLDPEETLWSYDREQFSDLLKQIPRGGTETQLTDEARV